MTSAAESKLARFFRERPWISLANSTLLGGLLFLANHGRSGAFEIVAWLGLGVGVVSGLGLVGVLAARRLK